MKDLLARGQRAVLEELARARCLCAFDFDGTLAPIVADRDAAAMAPTTRALLAEVAARYPSAVISGRALPDLEARLAGLPLAFLAGNHGADWSGARGVEAHARQVAAWRAELEAALAATPGVDIEDKRLSLSVHFRRAPDPHAAERIVARAAAALAGVRLVRGKCVLNVVPADSPDKGAALRAMCERLEVGRALYVGDDVTDEHAFALAGVLAVRVGESRASRAAYFLRSQREIDDLLGVLVALRDSPAPRA